METTKIRNESGDTITKLTEIKIIIRKFYRQLYMDKLNNLEKLDKYTETQTQKQIEISAPYKKVNMLNRQSNISNKKSPGIGCFTGKCYEKI